MISYAENSPEVEKTSVPAALALLRGSVHVWRSYCDTLLAVLRLTGRFHDAVRVCARARVCVCVWGGGGFYYEPLLRWADDQQLVYMQYTSVFGFTLRCRRAMEGKELSVMFRSTQG